MKRLTILGIVLIIGICLLSLFLVDNMSGLYRTLIIGFMLGSALAYNTLLEEN